MSYRTGKEKAVIGFLLSLTTQITLMRVQKAQPFAPGAKKTALQKQIGNVLWDKSATVLLSTVKADTLLS